MKKPITEEDGTHKEWMERAKSMTLDELPEFLRELTEDYSHDYGTICHAIAAAAVAAAWAVERSPAGGITGFQAGAVTWEILRGWNGSMLGDIGTKIVKYDDLLFPQYAEKWSTISPEIWDALQSTARAYLDEMVGSAPSVEAHWQSIADGNIPAGFTVSH